MDDLEKSLTYVPTYQVVEQIRKEEKKIARDAITTERKQKEALLIELINRNVSIETIAQILNITPKAVEKIVKKNNIF